MFTAALHSWPAESAAACTFVNAMRGEVLGQRQASPRPSPLPGFYHLPPRAGPAIIDSVFAGAPPEEIEQLCAFLLDGDDGEPLQAGKRPSSAQPALSCAVAPPRDQRSPPAAQPQTPFSAIAASAWPAHVSPFALATTPAPKFTPPRSASGSGGPPSPAHTGDRALSWLANWCARAEAEGIECLPPPSQSSWQQLVASGSLSGTLTQSTQSLPPPPPPLPVTSAGPSAANPSAGSRANSGLAGCHRCGGPGGSTLQPKRRRMDASQITVRWTVPECYI
ncbi:hypothetical protein COHA_002778 [Chlorella ohadii]|uniref:Uncharacterized protein n=1 Tax=Chlorella ohadii TaxID=2649997 RepID=A0AAD5DUU4_9CHLO|nr:hypothetical protein COHA_002778 [Chlorella ohadii]